MIVFLVVFQTGNPKYYSLLRTLTQWDGQHYLSIARDGYEKLPCGWNPSYICGNVGWFPFYPILGKITALTGLDHRFAMIGVTWLSLWAALLLMFRLISRRWGETSATIALVSLLLFPTSFYFLTVFPYAVFLLIALWAFYLLETEKYSLLALPCALLAVTYPSGAVIGLPVGWVLIRNWKKLSAKNRLALLMSMFAIGLALFLYCVYYWWRFGDFFLYLHFQSQSYYAHQAAIPLLTIVRTLRDFPVDNPVSLILMFVTIATILFYTRRIPVSWQIFMFGILLFTPTLGTTDCYYRHVIVAWPLFAMIGLAFRHRWRRYVLILYAIASVILTWQVFLPAYKAGRLM
ncbi:MAG: hypothetical protein U9R56_04360 [candidate division Zixibacteria bacterium]|nr:hypothetical protein [candidate division Zixibacteria bacterium]